MPAHIPLITVITVVYNGVAHLEQAINSVLTQKTEDIEYIIIDGGSTDGTVSVIQNHEQGIDYWCSEPDRGIYDAMNKGIGHARGAYIVMLNADDWYEPGILEKVVAEIRSHFTEINPVLYCDYYSWDASFTPPLRTAETCTMKYWRGMTVSHQTLFVPRKLYDTLGLYCLDYRFAADYEFLLRLLKHGVPCQKIGVYGVNFRKGGASDRHMNASIREVSRILRAYYGMWGREYALFLLTNRLPSFLGYIRRMLTWMLGKGFTERLRKLWRRF